MQSPGIQSDMLKLAADGLVETPCRHGMFSSKRVPYAGCQLLRTAVCTHPCHQKFAPSYGDEPGDAAAGGGIRTQVH
jgi:hypothetical protein